MLSKLSVICERPVRRPLRSTCERWPSMVAPSNSAGPVTRRVNKKPKKPPKGLFWRNDILWIRYRNHQGRLVRESTGQTSIKFAEDCYRKRKTEVAERKHFPSREFDKIQFGELLDYWWHKHAKHKSSKFNYLLPRLQRFKKLKARTISSDMIQSFLFELRDTEELSATSANHYRTILNSTTCGTSESGLEGFAGWLKCRTL